MLSVKNILVPTDYSSSAEIARTHALFLAKQWGANVHLLHILEGATTSAPTIVHAQREKAQANCEACGVDVMSYMQEGQAPAMHIIRHIREHDIDLVVMGARGQTGYSDYLRWGADLLHLGHTAEQVVRMAPCPVLTFGPRGKRDRESLKRILVPVGLDEQAKAAMQAGQWWAEVYGAEVIVMHVDSAEKLAELASAPSGDGYYDYHEPVREQLRMLWEATGGDPDRVTYRVYEGQPRKVIVKAAMQDNIQGVVLCRRTPTTSLEEALGSIAYQVASVIPCPVLMLPPMAASMDLPASAPRVQQPYSKPTM